MNINAVKHSNKIRYKGVVNIMDTSESNLEKDFEKQSNIENTSKVEKIIRLIVHILAYIVALLFPVISFHFMMFLRSKGISISDAIVVIQVLFLANIPFGALFAFDEVKGGYNP